MAKDFLTVREGLLFRPTAIEPESPKDGDWYFSDGTLRDAGLWVYKDGAWSASGGTGGIGSGGPSDTKTANYTVIDPDDFGKIINVDTTAMALTITLPAVPSAGFTVTVKDYKGTSGTNKITVVTTGSTDGRPSLEVLETNYTAVTFISDGTDWYRIGRFFGNGVLQRGLFGGGLTTAPANSNIIDYISIGTLANATDFGDLSVTRIQNASCSSSIRGLWAGGSTGADSNVIDYVIIATLGNALDFGDLTVARLGLAGCSSSTRGLFGGGTTGAVSNVIDYVTLATIGNATDFGDLTSARSFPAALASPTRGVWGGGNPGAETNIIDYVTIATLGNAIDFGDLTVARQYPAGCSNATRGLFAGGGAVGNTVIDYITIATLGDALDFGDLTQARAMMAACASPLRAVFAGGYETGAATAVNTIDYVTIATLANAIDFGDLSVARRFFSGCSNVHGGL